MCVNMFDAELYNETNQWQRRDVKKFLDEFSHLLEWRINDSLLDIGCGTGDVTIDFVLPLMANGSKIVGLDSSEDMVKFATEKYGYLENVEFILQNIEDDIDLDDLKRIGQFHHVTSFYCFHWVKNQRKAFQNVYNFLQPNGDCLMLMVLENPFFEVCMKSAKSERWSSYAEELAVCVSPLYNSVDPVFKLRMIMNKAGFRSIKVQAMRKIYDQDMLSFKNFLLGVLMPFSAKLPPAIQDYLLSDFFQLAIDLGLISDFEKITTNYIVLLTYGKK